MIAGKARGRQLVAGRGKQMRPTAVKVRGAIFNMLESRFALRGARILDLFAGTGSLGIEALSRQAAGVTFVECSEASLGALRRNLQECGFSGQARVMGVPVLAALRRLQRLGEQFDGILADPPYEAGWVDRVLRAVAAARLVRPGGWVVVEHSVREPPAAQYGPLRLTRERRYGKTAVALFVAEMYGEPAP